MQVSFQNDNNIDKNLLSTNPAGRSLGVSTSGLNFKQGQANLQPHKTQNENYGNRRLYSPYLSPSNAVISQITKNKMLIDPIYVQNMARTKYFNISKPPKPADHNKLNVLA